MPTPSRSPAPAGRPAAGGATSNLFGRFFLPGATSAGPREPESSILVEPRSDPAADAAIKRRVEQQIARTLGSRVRTVEVRVNGRSVVIRARAARFWQRRGVRHSLETLPLPAGYRTRVEMLD
jgi:hypothetical protein